MDRSAGTWRRLRAVAGFVTLVALLVPFSCSAQDQAGAETAAAAEKEADASPAVPKNPFPNVKRAPDNALDGGAEWLNVSGEISLRDLRGKVVLIDFWTYCCINCIHILPDLKYLEKKYANQLVVIGVHSAKFDTERDTDSIREAILRYEIEHPVVNDNRRQIWQNFHTRSWPTLALIDPEGYYVGRESGEGNRELFDTVIGRIVEYHRAKGTLDETPVRFDLERNHRKPTPLRYPGKVLADDDGGRLFISDSNHNRIVMTDPDGRLKQIIGTGRPGLADGAFDVCEFDHPQGMAIVGDTLYVADTENHCLRTIDLNAQTVATLAGTGQQARRRVASGPLDSTALNSPWDLEHVAGTLYVAMAGSHQIWSCRIGHDMLGVFAGSGREDVRNGRREAAMLAQPSGITSDGAALYVADSEGSAIRRIDLGEDGQVSTVAGTSDLPRGRSLFEFGDRDGIGQDVRLQHPLGVAYGDGILYVADTYNHKIRTISLADSRSTTWLGDGQRGTQLTPPRFSEPAGLSIGAGRLFIADTNNHRICAADLETGEVSVVEIDGLTPPKNTERVSTSRPLGSEPTLVEPQALKAQPELRFEIGVNLPKGYKINPLAPVLFRLEALGEQTLVADEFLGVRLEAQVVNETIIASVSVPGTPGEATYELFVSWNYCRDGVGGLCRIGTGHWQIPVTMSADATVGAVVLKVL